MIKVSVLRLGFKYSPIQRYQMYWNPGLSKEFETCNVYSIVQLYYPLTYLMSFTNCFLSPSYLVLLGPGICLLASILSPWSEDRHLANTASADKQIKIQIFISKYFTQKHTSYYSVSIERSYHKFRVTKACIALFPIK